MAEQGFKINGKFFPFVSYEDWLNQDFVLARQLTHVATDELFGDPVLLEQALVAVAFQHKNPHIRSDLVVEFVGSLKPGDVEDVGFDATEEDPDPLPEGGPNGNDGSSTPSSDASTEQTPESSTTDSSGDPGSDTGSQA